MKRYSTKQSLMFWFCLGLAVACSILAGCNRTSDTPPLASEGMPPSAVPHLEWTPTYEIAFDADTYSPPAVDGEGLWDVPIETMKAYLALRTEQESFFYLMDAIVRNVSDVDRAILIEFVHARHHFFMLLLRKPDGLYAYWGTNTDLLGVPLGTLGDRPEGVYCPVWGQVDAAEQFDAIWSHGEAIDMFGQNVRVFGGIAAGGEMWYVHLYDSDGQRTNQFVLESAHPDLAVVFEAKPIDQTLRTIHDDPDQFRPVDEVAARGAEYVRATYVPRCIIGGVVQIMFEQSSLDFSQRRFSP
jgi:hypothetical protein